jgi:hypothetical protein
MRSPKFEEILLRGTKLVKGDKNRTIDGRKSEGVIEPVRAGTCRILGHGRTDGTCAGEHIPKGSIKTSSNVLGECNGCLYRVECD